MDNIGWLLLVHSRTEDKHLQKNALNLLISFTKTENVSFSEKNYKNSKRCKFLHFLQRSCIAGASCIDISKPIYNKLHTFILGCAMVVCAISISLVFLDRNGMVFYHEMVFFNIFNGVLLLFSYAKLISRCEKWETYLISGAQCATKEFCF